MTPNEKKDGRRINELLAQMQEALDEIDRALELYRLHSTIDSPAWDRELKGLSEEE